MLTIYFICAQARPLNCPTSFSSSGRTPTADAAKWGYIQADFISEGGFRLQPPQEHYTINTSTHHTNIPKNQWYLTVEDIHGAKPLDHDYPIRATQELRSPPYSEREPLRPFSLGTTPHGAISQDLRKEVIKFVDGSIPKC